jgi:hypothetical protein
MRLVRFEPRGVTRHVVLMYGARAICGRAPRHHFGRYAKDVGDEYPLCEQCQDALRDLFMTPGVEELLRDDVSDVWL